MKLTHLVLASTISAFALISTGASAETYHFGEGQSSMSGTGSGSRHAPPPKHRKHKKTRHTADKGAYSQPSAEGLNGFRGLSPGAINA